MKKFLSYSLAAVGAILIQSTAFADLIVTEINSNAPGGDFFEVTNFGSISIDLSNGSWDDDSFTPGTVVLPSALSIAPGESIIFLADANASAVGSFRTLWNIPASVQIIGVTNSIGLGGGDAVRLFDSANQTLATLSYAIGGFTRSNGTQSIGGHAGLSAGGTLATQSLIWDPTSGTTAATARYTFANGTNFGSYAATNGALGSPGVSAAAVPEPSTYMMMGAGLSALVILARRRRSSN